MMSDLLLGSGDVLWVGEEVLGAPAVVDDGEARLRRDRHVPAASILAYNFSKSRDNNH